MRHKKSFQLPMHPPEAIRPAPSGPARTRSSRRFLLVHLPFFRLERCGWHAEQAVVLVAEERSALRVQVASSLAAAVGVRPGMPIAEARVMASDETGHCELAVELAVEAAEELEDLRALCLLFERISPMLQVLPPDSFLVELHGGREEPILKRAAELLEELGHSGRLVIADEPQGALALARVLEQDQIVPPGQLQGALAPLSVSVGTQDPRLLQVLRDVGILRLGQLAVLPASSVARRFGEEGLRLHRLARGEEPAPVLEPAPESARLVLRRQLPESVDQLEAVLFVLNELASRLQHALAARERAAVRLQLRLGLDDAPDFLLPVRMGQPRRSARDLMGVLRKRLEGLRLGGQVGEVAIEVLEDCPFLGRQQGLLDRSGANEPLEDLLGRLADALGEDAIYSPRMVERHRPELAWGAARFSRRRRREEHRVEGPERPTILLREPLPIRAQLHDGRIESLQIEGRWSNVARHSRAERLRGDWWIRCPFERDYFTVDLHDGRRAWVFRDLDGGLWWLQGWWD
jgi:protein ImuB